MSSASASASPAAKASPKRAGPVTERMQLSSVPVEASTEYLYKEYVRLHGLVTELTRSSFEDFKLLTVVGGAASFLLTAIGAWGKDAHHDFFHRHLGDGVPGVPLDAILLLGFLTLFALVAIVAFRDHLKQGLIAGLMESIAPYESELHGRIGVDGAFELIPRAKELLQGRQRERVLAFQLVFAASVVGLPYAALRLFTDALHANLYLGIAGAVTVAFVWMGLRLYRRG